MDRLTALDDVLLARVLTFLCAREVEAAAVASRVVAREVLPRFPQVWAALFRHRWAALNFPLDDARLAIDHRLRSHFPPSYSESRVFQLLAHAVTPLPAYVDLQRTRRSRGFDATKHEVEALHNPETRESLVTSFGFNGGALGDDRCVRANAPFPATAHIAVFKRRSEHDGHDAPLFEVGLVASGYFELSVSTRDAPRHPRTPPGDGEGDAGGEQAQAQPQEELASIGLVPDSFPLVGRQPGWNQHSVGYHSDNGHMYRQSAQGQFFGPRFGVGDTVGCGVRRDQRRVRSSVFFSHNGKRINRDEGEVACQHASLYPAVGIDSFQQLTVNFGQREFQHDTIVDEMFAECDAAFDACGAVKPEDALPWFEIDDGYAAWRRLRRSKLHSLGRLVTEEYYNGEYDEYGDEVEMEKEQEKEEGECPRQAMVKKWIGLLTRQQQRRLEESE